MAQHKNKELFFSLKYKTCWVLSHFWEGMATTQAAPSRDSSKNTSNPLFVLALFFFFCFLGLIAGKDLNIKAATVTTHGTEQKR